VSGFRLQAGDGTSRVLEPGAAPLTIGRAAENGWVLEDATLSRRHASLQWRPEGVAVTDLGSRFGTSVNGRTIPGETLARPGDELLLGTVRVAVLAQPAEPGEALQVEPGAHQPAEPETPLTPPVRIDAHATTLPGLVALTLPAAELRRGAGAGAEGQAWAQAIAFIQEFTLGLIRDVTPRDLLESLLEKLQAYLEADRGVVLLRGPDGALRPEAVRQRGRRGQEEIRLSRTLVEAALDRREALLLTDPQNDPELGSRSLILSGIASALVIPLENDGEVAGLLYFDSRSRLRPFTRDDLQLAATLAHVAAAKLQAARLRAEAERTRALEHEMGIARAIQLRMLPRNSLGEGPVDLYAELRAAREVGGDLFDYQWQQGRLWFCIGDVAGKGVPAALVMALTKTLFRANGAFMEDPAQLMAAVNALIYEETGPGIFVSALCGCLDPASGRLLYSNGGHERPLLAAPGRAPRLLEARAGLALGILPDFAYRVEEATLAPGEALLLYTDGVTEAVDPERRLFGLERLVEALAQAPEEGSRERVRHLFGALDSFSAGAAQADDITLMCLRVP
jgi:serine phosphatase RsbU (regulator of sigma subunit)